MFLLEKIKNHIPNRYRKKLSFIKWKLRVLRFQSEQYVKVHDQDTVFTIFVNPKNGYVDEYLYLHHHWESHISEQIVKNLHPEDVFVDVGANIGYFSLLAGSKLKGTGKVFAFEPLPRLVTQLKKSVEANNIENITVINKACGNKSAQLELSTSSKNIGGSSLVSLRNATEKNIVNVVRLDEELSSCKTVNFIKIDVEGFEYEVLQGAQNIIEKFKPKILLEFSPQFYMNMTYDVSKDIIVFLLSYNYKLYDLSSGKYIVDSESFLIELSKKQTDIYCC